MRHVIIIFALILFASLGLFGCTLASTDQLTSAPPPTPQPGFQGQQAPTPIPTIPRDTFTTPVFITLTPIVTVEPIDIVIPEPQPGEQTENIVEALINRVLIPAWNFIYTFITGSIIALWDFAGLRGGLSAQIIFCLIPAIVVTMGVLWRVFRRAR
jgi:hypothetical protein